TGCDVLMQKVGELDSFSKPFIVDGLYMGTPVVESETFSLSEDDVLSEAQITLHLASTSFDESMNTAPISSAVVQLTSDNISPFPIPESSEAKGSYTASANEGLPYPAGEYITIDVERSNGTTHQIGITAPLAPMFSLPAGHPTSEALSIDVSDQEYYESFVIVLRADTGEITYQKFPQTVEELYEYAHPNAAVKHETAEYIEQIQIPPSAFPSNTVYAVGIAGIQSSLQEDMIEVNTLISSLIAGQFRFQDLCVPDCDTLMSIE
ncbi:MAG: hypothetical protein VX278_23630, partial [Myxococcota bacterium]|nr:hypothetical protein [Myxococcota bacterium]